MQISNGADTAHESEPAKDEETNSMSHDQQLDERVVLETGTVVDALLAHAVEVRGSDRTLTRKVAARADAIARDLHLDEDQRSVIRRAALLRDVGKAGVPDSILKKAGPLTASEYEQVRARLLPEDDIEDTDSVRAAIMIAYHHHERMDGKGFPEQLDGEYIPLGSRILAVAEAYETMLIDAPWRRARKPDEALKEMFSSSNSQFDRTVVDALARTVNGNSAAQAQISSVQANPTRVARNR